MGGINWKFSLTVVRPAGRCYFCENIYVLSHRRITCYILAVLTQILVTFRDQIQNLGVCVEVRLEISENQVIFGNVGTSDLSCHDYQYS